MTGGSGKPRHWRYEHRREPLASRGVFLRRLAVHGGVGFGIVMVSLAIGMAGYRATEGMGWIDAFLNASMILGGMGPVDQLRTDGGRIFAGMYSLFSGVVFLVVVGVMFAPLAHRMLHKLHIDGGPDR
ncbi:MAG: hypothetical protein Q7W29_14925 [bacterium]|nr:hypothetical protein [bacterium]